MIGEPHVHVLTAQLRECLERAIADLAMLPDDRDAAVGREA
jgi:hypothetical protein